MVGYDRSATKIASFVDYEIGSRLPLTTIASDEEQDRGFYFPKILHMTSHTASSFYDLEFFSRNGIINNFAKKMLQKEVPSIVCGQIIKIIFPLKVWRHCRNFNCSTTFNTYLDLHYIETDD